MNQKPNQAGEDPQKHKHDSVSSFFATTDKPTNDPAKPKDAPKPPDNPQDIKPGDAVRLKGSGPKMVVEQANPSDCVAVWFDGNELKTATFKYVVVEKVAARV